MNNGISRLRLVSVLEGCSYLLLLGIAMPLKYAAGMPEAVRLVGMLHGLLFVAFALALALVVRNRELSLREATVVMLWSLVPLGFLPIDAKLRSLPQPEPVRA